MTLVDLPSFLCYPDSFRCSSVAAFTTSTIDASGEMVALIFRAPKTGNISHIGYLPAVATGSPAVDVRLETVDGAGQPSGTLVATNTNASHSPSSNTWAWVPLTAAAAVTKGDLLAAKIAYSSGTSLTLPRWNIYPSDRSFPYGAVNFGSAGRGGNPPIAIKYDDGSIPSVMSMPVSSTTITETINSGTTPDEKGIKFTVPMACKCVGAVVRVNGASTTFSVKLYDGSNNVLASVAGVDGDQTLTAGADISVVFSSDVTLAAGTTYRLTVLPATSSNITVYRAVVDASATREAWPGGTAFQATERTDAGGWTDTATQVPMMALLLSALDDGATVSRAGELVNSGGLVGG